MNRNIHTSLIISTYNRPDALKLCIESALRQSLLPDEILIADDGSDEKTQETIQRLRELSAIPLIHIWHEDSGFRLAAIRNKAIAATRYEYILQIDGDIILHKDFVKDHTRFAREKSFVSGSRVLLSEELTNKLLAENNSRVSIRTAGTKNLFNGLHLPCISPLMQHYRQQIVTYCRGCNMAFWKKDLLQVNGYNESITGWGFEDIELACRLINNGIAKRTLKFAGIEFHLHHPQNSKERFLANSDILTEAQKNNTVRCENGIAKYL